MLVALLIGAGNCVCHAQNDRKIDTLQCHSVGFNFGLKLPSTLFSHSTTPEGTVVKDDIMAAIYQGPYWDYGLNCIYKYKSNWLVTLDGNMWIGENNLTRRQERLGDVYTHDAIASVLTPSGFDAVLNCYNRGLSFTAGVGKLFPFDIKKNPNTGIMARVNAGYMFQQTIFTLQQNQAPQIMNDLSLLYDHQRQGVILNEGVGYWLMSNKKTLANLYLEFQVQQCWSFSTRDYVIDYALGLRGPDHNRHFDMMYTLKFCWMIPLTGKPSYDYYYF